MKVDSVLNIQIASNMRPARCLSQLFMSCLTLNRLSYAQTDARSTTDPEATTSVDVGNNPSKDEFLRRSDFIGEKPFLAEIKTH